MAVVVASKLAFAAWWGLLPDEAYYWVWSLHPSLGYYDQPPLIAWMLVPLRGLHSELAVRVFPVLCAGLVWWGGAGLAKDQAMWAAWSLLLPPLAVLTWFATPDAPLLAACALSLAALKQERWELVGAALGVGLLAKLTAGLWLVLLLIGARPSPKEAGKALLVAAAVMSPSLWFMATDGPVHVLFQVREGWLHPDPPGLWGPLRLVTDQLLFATPIAATAGAIWGATHALSEDRIDRTLATIGSGWLVFFGVSALFGPPEAHWVAPAWLALGLGVCRASERWARAREVGGWLGALVTIVLALHTVMPLGTWKADPTAELWRGQALGDEVGRFALPIGVAAWEPGVERSAPVATERYQEAALVHFYTGIEAVHVAGCGREDHYTLNGAELRGKGLFVRPSRGGPLTCLPGEHPPPARLKLPGGGIDVFEVEL